MFNQINNDFTDLGLCLSVLGDKLMFNGKKIIAVCIPKAYDETSFRYLTALNEHAVKKGFTLFVYQTCTDLYNNSTNDTGENYVFDLIDYDIVEGIVLFSELLKDDEVVQKIANEAKKRGIPAISVERAVEGCINAHYDYSDCFEKIVRHIIVDHKLTKVNFIAGIKGNSFSEERLDIYKKVIEEQGIPYDQERVGYGEFWDFPTRKVMENFLADGKELPEAIICSNDTMAMAACGVLYEHGYSVPEDVIVSGFDGIEDEQYHTPRLTTCRNSTSDMSEKIVSVIDDAVSGGKLPDEIIVGFEMVKSQSCGCAAKRPADASDMILDMHRRFEGYYQRNSLMNVIMALISSKRKPEHMIEIFDAKEMFYGMHCCLNIDALEPKTGEVGVDSDDPFTDEMLMIYRGSYFDPSTRVIKFKRKDIVPGFEKHISMDVPLVFTSVHYLDIPLGYLCMSIDLTLESYDRIPQVAETYGNGFGNVRMYTAMERLYTYDPLTELYNRRGFYQLIVPEFENAVKEQNSIVAFVSADLDGLKYINDTFGHAEGDNAIKTAAAALAYAAVNGEICARFGGDEFVVAGVLTMSPEEYDRGFKQRVKEYIDNYNNTSGKPYKVATSIGITCRSPVGATVDELIKLSDDLMYADKASRKTVRSRPRD